MAQAISDFIRKVNEIRIDALVRNGYMSGQDPSFTGQGFACNRCDWKRESERMKEQHLEDKVLFCINPNITAYVERTACCNLFTYHGVHT